MRPSTSLLPKPSFGVLLSSQEEIMPRPFSWLGYRNMSFTRFLSQSINVVQINQSWNNKNLKSIRSEDFWIFCQIFLLQKLLVHILLCIGMYCLWNFCKNMFWPKSAEREALKILGQQKYSNGKFAKEIEQRKHISKLQSMSNLVFMLKQYLHVFVT